MQPLHDRSIHRRGAPAVVGLGFSIGIRPLTNRPDANELDQVIDIDYFSSKSPSLLPSHFVVGACIEIVIRTATKVTDAII